MKTPVTKFILMMQIEKNDDEKEVVGGFNNDKDKGKEKRRKWKKKEKNREER